MGIPALKPGEAPLVRACRFCGCTDDRACPGGCAWATEDICTSCLGHTPQSWAALRQDGADAIMDGTGRPQVACLLSAMAHSGYALDALGGHLADHTLEGAFGAARSALDSLLLAVEDLLDANGAPDDAPLRLALVAHAAECAEPSDEGHS